MTRGNLNPNGLEVIIQGNIKYCDINLDLPSDLTLKIALNNIIFITGDNLITCINITDTKLESLGPGISINNSSPCSSLDTDVGFLFIENMEYENSIQCIRESKKRGDYQFPEDIYFGIGAQNYLFLILEREGRDPWEASENPWWPLGSDLRFSSVWEVLRMYMVPMDYYYFADFMIEAIQQAIDTNDIAMRNKCLEMKYLNCPQLSLCNHICNVLLGPGLPASTRFESF